ncbi:MAG: DNA polymerase I [Thermoanaerobacterales bacterium]|nr:DNA polymerase I [Bacillota bacterium]MDI6907532.1 DNA polymerase I [Thermoanaerobacterales bacterium]
MERLLLIDGNSLVHRAFHALPPLSTTTGLPTNAVLGFTRMLLKVLDAEQPAAVIVAFDKGRATFRHDAFDAYKAHRPATPEDLRPQLALVKEILESMRIPIRELEGYEADDIIGTLCRFGEDRKMAVTVLTGDQDALQLVSPHTEVLITRKGISELERYDEAAVVRRFGLNPPQLVDMKGLAGDPSDNIPGIPGIGMKTAAKLVQTYGRLDEILTRTDELPLRLRRQLETYADQARLSRDLAAIDRQVPGITAEDIEPWPGPDYDRLLRVFTKLEFKSLSREIVDRMVRPESEQAVTVYAPPYERAETAEQIRDVLAVARSAGEVCLAFGGSRASGLSALGLAAGDALLYMPLPPDGSDGLEVLADFLADETQSKLTYDAKEAYWLCHIRRLSLAGLAFDTTVAAYLLNPAAGTLKIEDLALEYLQLVLPPGGEEALPARAACLRRLVPALQARLRAQEQEDLFSRVELPLTGVLARMEMAGVRVDRAQLTRMSEEFGERIRALEEEIYTLAGERFNVSSPKQLGEILFGKLGLPKGKKTKTGYSTDARVLEELAGEHEIAALVLEHRQLVKLKGTYTDGLAALIDPVTGTLHTTLHQTVTATGRLSSAEPNLQNIPIRMEIGRRIRRVFIPGDTANVLLTADYSQIELRILAHLSGDTALIEAFNLGQDIHARTAAEVFGLPLDKVTPELRRRAKAVNFGIVYGISDFGLARDLRIPRAEAARYIENYFTRLPGVKAFIERTVREARDRGYVTTILNRRRYLPDLFSPNRAVRNFGERAAMNSPIQGSAADIIKLAMVNIDRRLAAGGFKTRMILQVHDELIFDVPSDELCEVAPLVKKEMEQVVRLDVPLVVDLKVGNNWYEVRPLEEVTKCLSYPK